MIQEKNCKWYFGPESAGNIQGPNSATALTFGGEKYNSLIRESIQNSLDAVYDRNHPVKVSFAYRSFNRSEFPEFFKLKDHIKGCLNCFPEQGKQKFNDMLRFFDNTTGEIGYIRIVDTNTKGMSYNREDSESPFNAFISEGTTANADDGAGGAFGFGKAVFWNLSPISTIFVSSKTRKNGDIEEQINFVGKSKLCTHYITKGNLLLPNGLYSTNGSGEVITIEDAIPDCFKPCDFGTSVYVIGAPNIDEKVKEELIKATLKNFWMAIYEKKLVVEIERTVIDKASLGDLMEQYFDNEHNYNKDNNEYNPRPFYNIYLNAVSGKDGFKYISDDIEIGDKECKVKLYIHINQEARGHLIFMRSPLMLVYSNILTSCRGANGIFICDDENGNKFLRETEPSSHDGWEKKFYVARNPNSDGRVASKALKAIKEFITETVKNELKEGALETEQVKGLEEILTINTPTKADSDSNKDDIVDPDTISEPKKDKRKPTPPKQPIIHRPKVAKTILDPNGRLLSNRGRRRRKHPHVPGPPKPGDYKNKRTESPDGNKSISAEPIDVFYRTWCDIDEDKHIWHIIRIFSNETIEKALIQVYGVSEDDKIIGLHILEAPGYEVRVGEEFSDTTDSDETDDNSKGTLKQVKNAIYGVHINANEPKTIKIRFNSDIKYALCINSDKLTYENQ